MPEISGLRKALITPERNKIERSALRRSKENTFFLPVICHFTNYSNFSLRNFLRKEKQKSLFANLYHEVRTTERKKTIIFFQSRLSCMITRTLPFKFFLRKLLFFLSSESVKTDFNLCVLQNYINFESLIH
jgi:hypothetical protein